MDIVKLNVHSYYRLIIDLSENLRDARVQERSQYGVRDGLNSSSGWPRCGSVSYKSRIWFSDGLQLYGEHLTRIPMPIPQCAQKVNVISRQTTCASHGYDRPCTNISIDMYFKNTWSIVSFKYEVQLATEEFPWVAGTSALEIPRAFRTRYKRRDPTADPCQPRIHRTPTLDSTNFNERILDAGKLTKKALTPTNCS